MTIRVSYPTWVDAVREISTFWNAAFNGTNRLTRGVETKQDLIVDNTTSGLILKSPNGHYWRATISDLGAVTWADLGTTKP
jgi:hypothetical protein